MWITRLWTLIVAVIPTVAAHAGAEIDLASLPQYCDPKYRETAKWTHGLSLHHYCNGLDHLNKYYSAKTKDGRSWHYNHAMAEFNYVLKNPDPSRNPLVGDQYLSRGLAHALVKRYNVAVKDWYRAIEINPKLLRAYLELAHYMASGGQKEQALKVVTAGLANLPDDKTLKRLYEKLGGKLPYPEPLEKAAGGKPAGEQTTPAEQKTTQAVAQPPAVEGAAAKEKPANPTQPAQAQTAPAPMGTPKNPYCRFCPE